MTNSIASSKCPSALTSGNYGMSQDRYTDETKEYIFVKLTDSAYRAIEEYQRNENSKRFTNGQHAKIQFIGNSGVIHFPTPDSNDEGRKFGFAIDDIEGSLECIHQSHTDHLDVLGSMSYRMRIHANDDVYDTTRTKMAIAEETEKSKCIREIKPNQTDIGRKVKKLTPSTAAVSYYQQQQQQQQQHHNHHHHSINSNGSNPNNVNNSGINGNNNINSNYNSLRIHNSNINNFLNNSNSRSKLPSLCGNSNNSFSSLSSNATHSSTTTSSSLASSSGVVAGVKRSPTSAMLGSTGTNSNSMSNNRYNSNGNHTSLSSVSQQLKISSPAMSSTTMSASSLSSTLAGGIANGYASVTNNSPSEAHVTNASALTTVSSNSLPTRKKLGFLGGTGSGLAVRNNSSFLGGKTGMCGNSSSGGNANSGSNVGVGKTCNASTSIAATGKTSNVSKCKIRERLIHLLALKPFKKPELYSRLRNEGIKERERNSISNLLKEIATLSRDNTYNLRRQIWNDVNENWPYYTEQELQQLKRRKPQNLTPPLSSDAGSSTSGQSPTSTHTGSPPPMVSNGLSGSNAIKRTSNDYDDSILSGIPSKKQRISHFKKDPISGTCGLTGNRLNLGITSGSNGNVYGSSGLQSRGIAYSPHSGHGNSNGGTHGPDENSGNSDLSYNVLDNMDEFMPNVEQSTYFGGPSGSSIGINSNRRSFNGGTDTKSSGTGCKEKRSSSGSSSSNTSTTSGGYVSNQERNCTGAGKKVMSKKAAASASVNTSSALQSSVYGGSFVPESKLPIGGNNNNNSNLNSSNNRINGGAGGSGNYQLKHQNVRTSNSGGSNNSGIQYSQGNSTYPLKMHHGTSPRDEIVSTSQNRSVSSGSTGGNRYQQQSAAGCAGAGLMSRSSSSKANRISIASPSQYYGQSAHQQQNSNNTNNTNQHQQNHCNQQKPLQTAVTVEQQPQQQHSSPTQQIAAAATSYSSAATTSLSEKPRYDFSNYTTITTIEQRRHYKTEFESDYDEYRKLLAQIEGVGQRFRGLAQRLENARQGCPDYNNIKQQIVSEYERIQNEETLKRDKLRFDYLHEKLAHIKQLVMDYDKTLTAAYQQQQQQQQQQQHDYQYDHQSNHQPQHHQSQHQSTWQHHQHPHSHQQPSDKKSMYVKIEPTDVLKSQNIKRENNKRDNVKRDTKRDAIIRTESNPSTSASSISCKMRLSPMVQSGGESNHSPPLISSRSNVGGGVNVDVSVIGGFQQQHHQLHHAKQQQQLIQQTHHHNNETQQQYQQHQQQSLHRAEDTVHSSSNISQQHKQRHHQKHQQQQLKYNNLNKNDYSPSFTAANISNNIINEDSDSDDSSDSNSNDDDSSDSNSNSNDDDDGSDDD